MSHGGNIKKLQQLAGEGIELIDFSASINPLGSPSWLRQEVARTISQLAHYPDIDCTELTQAVSEAFKMPPANFVIANGTTEVIFQLPEILNLKKAVIAEPAYIDYRTAATRSGLQVKSIKLREGDNFELDINELEKVLKTPALVFLGHPNNPTSTLLDVAAVLSMIEIHSDSVFIIDEAYLSFITNGEEKSFIPHVSRLKNLVVLRSLTKIYAMAGIRLGLAFCSSELTKKIKERQVPWNINTLAQQIGVRAIRDSEFLAKSQENLAKLKGELISQLEAITNVTVYPAAANFILCRLSGKITASELFSKLIKEGLAIRTCSDFMFLDKSYFRVAVRNTQENAMLISCLHKVLSPAKEHKALKKRETPSLMILGSSSNAGKSIIAAALCRILLQDGVNVAPFKSQNMALNSYVTLDGLEMGRAQAVQAQASRLEADVRMNPILLKPNTDTGSQVIVMGKPVGNMRVYEYIKYKEKAFTAAQKAYDSLASEHDVIILEGAGSPGEINLKKHDIVNTRMAEYAHAPSLLVGDIDRGGVYASFIGMYETFEEWERKQVKGFLVNRFRGDARLLQDAHDYVKDFTGREVLGVIPYIKDLGLPEEDSVSFNDTFSQRDNKDDNTLDFALIAFPHLSNFTDFDALANEPDVSLRIVRNTTELGDPDCILLPGSKNVIGDLKFLQESRLAEKITTMAGKKVICGICGGFQIIGESVSDPHNIEGGGSISGLGLLPIKTILAKDKTLTRTEAVHKTSGHKVHGYEIHHGETVLPENITLFKRTDEQSIGAGSEMTWGTYIHGVFDADKFRRHFINTVHQSIGNSINTEVRYHYDLEPAFERLAETTRQALDMGKIYQLLRL